MGTAGYAGMSIVWAKEDLEAEAAGLPKVFGEIKDKRCRAWARARATYDESTNFVPTLKNPDDVEVYKKLVDFDAQQQAGTFKGDVLVECLGNKEHPGRTRGVGVFAPWKTGRKWTLEDKRESKRARKELYEKNLRESLKAEIMAELRSELKGELPARPSSSCASPSVTTAMDIVSYPCDDIEVNPLITRTKCIKLCISIWHPTHDLNFSCRYPPAASY